MAKARKKRRMNPGAVFLITFLSFLLVFGGLMVWGVSEYWQQNYAPKPVAKPTETAVPTASAPRVHRALLITQDAGEAQGFVVISAEIREARVRVIPVPRETVVTEGETQTRLFEYARTADPAAVTAQVASLLGMDIPHYAVLSYDNYTRLINYFNEGVIFTLGEAVPYDAPGGGQITMKAGVHTLTAPQAMELLRYTGWHSGRRGRADVQGNLVAAMINQYFVPARFDEEDRDFYAVIDLVQSDILTPQFIAARADLLALSRVNNRGVAAVIRPAGTYVGVGEAMRFEMAEDPLG